MTSRPSVKTEQQIDMESLFDFNQGTGQSPTSPSNDTLSPYGGEERRQFNGPSHDYGQFRQQVGVPLANLNMPRASSSNGVYSGFNSGFGDLDFNSGYGFNSGIDFDADMSMDFSGSQAAPPMFFPDTTEAQSDFINPSSIGAHEEPQSNVGRLWPGMHSQQAQQAAMAKAAQAQASQQRQIKLQAQHAQHRQASNVTQSQSSQGSSQQSQGNGKHASHAVEAHVEESISRLLSQMRRGGASSMDDADSSGMLPHIARMKKDEEEMDEDERLLASEEGKKLSSKERRQLRNKVSARAFRSRRKEYIGQLEGEVALKNQENVALRAENQSVMQENERYRGLIETLLRHPAFTPFINDISKDPSLFGVPQQHVQQHQQQQAQQLVQQQQSVTPAPPSSQQTSQQSQQDMQPEYPKFDSSQLQIPAPQPEQQHVNLATIPENDFSKLNINGFNSMNFNNYSVGAYAVTEVPAGPDPIEVLIDTPARLPFPRTEASNESRPLDAQLSIFLAKLGRAATNLEMSKSVCV